MPDRIPPLTDKQEQFILNNYKLISKYKLAQTLDVKLWAVRKFMKENKIKSLRKTNTANRSNFIPEQTIVRPEVVYSNKSYI